MRRATIALFLFATAARAQVSETIEVRVSNVDVVVTDRSGNPVTGLTKDDFEVFENGFARPITNFYEVREEPGAAPASTPVADVPADVRRRRVVIFVDHDSIDPGRRKQALEAASRGLDKMMRAGDEAMVITFSRERKHASAFTSDHEAVRKELTDALAQPTNASRAGDREQVLQNALNYLILARELMRRPSGAGFSMHDAYRISRNDASVYADQLFLSQKQLIRAIENTANAMAGLDGKKAVIVVGGDLQEKPGAELFQAIDALYRTTGVGIVSSTIGEANKRSVAGELDKVGRAANKQGVTLYLINTSDHSSSKGAQSSASLDTNQRSPHDTGIDLDAATSMTTLAASTGGQALIGSINYDLLFDTVARDLGSYYSLGYKPALGGGERTLLVKVKKPGLVARSRRSYTVKTTDEELNEQVVANAFYPRLPGDLAITIETGTARPDGENFELPVTIRIGELTTIPDGADVAGEFAVYFVTASPAGKRSPIARDVRPFRYSAAEAVKVRGKPVTYTASLRVRPGEQLVSVAVVDRIGGRSGFARAKFETAR